MTTREDHFSKGGAEDTQRHAPPHGPGRYPALAWATLMAILLGGLNALVQILRLALGH